VSEKKFVPETEKGALLHITARYPPPSPPLLPIQYCAIYFPHDPLYCNKILVMICLPPQGTPPPHSSRYGPQHTQHTASTAATPHYPQGRRQNPADAPTPLKRSMLTPFGGPRPGFGAKARERWFTRSNGSLIKKIKRKRKKVPRISSFQGGCGDPAQQQQPHFPPWAGPGVGFASTP